ncbi:MAG: phosphatidate cytidylyltransferase [Pseudomonadota bacterium]
MNPSQAASPVDRARKMSDLRPRVISGLVLGVVAAAAISIGGWATTILVAIAAAAMAWEYRDITLGAGTSQAGRITYSSIAAAGPILAHLTENILFGAAAAALGALGFWLYDARKGRDARWGGLGLGLVIFSTSAFVLLRDQEMFGFETIVWLVLVVVGTDVGGYFAGRAIGGPKLAPRLSPGKTWSGLGGGVALAAAIGSVFSALTTGTWVHEVVTVSVAAALVAVAGDLAESALKRRFGVKDASRLIPGHGGVLDRVDGLMAATLVAAAVTFARGKEVFIW